MLRLLLGLLASVSALQAASLTLHETRESPLDLAVTGKLAGVPANGTRYVRWSEMRQLPTRTVKLTDGEVFRGEQPVTIVMLADVWAALPRAPGADTLFAFCGDGYTSIYRQEFMASYHPFVILEINGVGPDKWPPPGMKYNPGPYVFAISTEVDPAVKEVLDAGHKRPWSVISVEVATYAEREKDAFSGKWSELSASAKAGREIWINSCASCHPGPGQIVGGTKSGRPFPVVAAHAGYNQDYFRKYVRAPTSVLPGAKMEAHPHYTDAQLDELIAFITADGKQ